MERDLFPPELREFYFDFDWDNERIWSLDLPVEIVPLSELEWHLDLPIWSAIPGQPRFDLVPNSVLQQLDAHPRHHERIENADVCFPIDTMWSQGRFVILDGVHRLAKLKIQGAQWASVRKIPREMIPHIQNDGPGPA